MIKAFKSLIIIIFFSTITIHANSETSWITNKSDKSKEEIKIEKKIKKAEVKKKSEWIKKKIKENKKEFKEEDKKITKEVKSWITKKDKKDKYIDNADNLPTANIYFAAKNDNGKIFYGYVNADLTSKKIGNYYETSKGKGYINDGKTICQIASTVIDLYEGEITGRVAGNCTDGTKFRGNFTQNMNLGYGVAKTNTGEKFDFDFTSKKSENVKLVKKFNTKENIIERKLPTNNNNKNIKLEPNGKYYALLIGNSNYDNNGWDDLISPLNDINEIKSVLDKSYKFEKIMMVRDGTKKEIFQAFKDLSKITTTNDYVLIYYSGHGQVKATQAYWVPVEGSLEWGNGDWININELNIFLTEIKAHHLAVMVDSCYVGGKFKGSNILDLKEDEQAFITDHLRDDLNLRARIVLSSGSEGRVSDTAPNSKNSIFASTFLNNLRIAEKVSIPLTMTTLGFNVKRSFTGNPNQKPYYYHPDTWTHLGGDFIFIPKQNLQ